jgi:hypothetical protein
MLSFTPPPLKSRLGSTILEPLIWKFAGLIKCVSQGRGIVQVLKPPSLYGQLRQSDVLMGSSAASGERLPFPRIVCYIELENSVLIQVSRRMS